MDNKQLISLTLRVLGIIVILAMLFLVNWIANERTPHIMQYGFLAILGMGMIGGIIYLHRLRIKIPGIPMHDFTNSLSVITFLIIAFLVIDFFDETSETPEWFLPIGFVIMLMWSAHAVFKQQQKRIEELEEKLKQQNQAKE